MRLINEKALLLIEDSYHTRLIDERTRYFVGHDTIIQKIISGSAKIHMPLMIAGEAGCGKSAIMAMAARKMKDTRPDDLIITRFVGESQSSFEINRLLLNIIGTVSQRFDIPFDDKVFENSDNIGEVFRQSLIAAAYIGNVVIFIDGLNLLMPIYNSHSLHWIPRELPDNIRLIVSTLPGEIVETAREEGFPIYYIPPFSLDNQRHLVTKLFRKNSKWMSVGNTLNEEQMDILFGKDNADKPLFLTVVCNELQNSQRVEMVTDQIRALPEYIPDLFGWILEKLEEDYGKQLITDIFSLIACSKNGLLESEFLDIVTSESKENLPINTWDNLSLSLSPYLRNTGKHREGMIGFYHKQMQLAVEKRYFDDDQIRDSYYRRLAKYGLEKYHQKKGDTTNSILYTGIYLYQAGDETRLCELMRDVFCLPEPLYSNYIGIVDALFDWVAYRHEIRDDIALSRSMEKISKDIPSIRIADFLSRKSNIYKNTGLNHEAIFCLIHNIAILKNLTTIEPENINILTDKAGSHSTIGNIYKVMGMYHKALDFYLQFVEVMEKLVHLVPDNMEFRHELSIIFHTIGTVYKDIGDNPHAKEFFEKALMIRKELVILKPERTDYRCSLALSCNHIASIHEYLGDNHKALEYFEEAMAIMESLLAQEPDNLDFRMSYATYLWNASFVCSEENKPYLLCKARTLLRSVSTPEFNDCY